MVILSSYKTPCNRNISTHISTVILFLSLSLALSQYDECILDSKQTIMGLSWCQTPEPHLEVTVLPTPTPNTPEFTLYRGTTNRHSDLAVLPDQHINYIFTLKAENQLDMRVKMPVLNELAHTAVHPNYKLDIRQKMIIDPMAPFLEHTPVSVRNDTSGKELSMRVIPFKGFGSAQFKQMVEEVWVYQKKLARRDQSCFSWLEDCFVYAVDHTRQAGVLLFERVDISLLWMGEYRREANWPWTHPQKIKIFYDLLESCWRLEQTGLWHRDIRPANIYYIRKRNRYVLGNMWACRSVSSSHQDDLMTVCGVEAFAEGRVKDLIAQKSDMGLYSVREQMYQQLKNVAIYLSTLTITQHASFYPQDQVTETLIAMLQTQVPLPKIMKYLQQSAQGTNFSSLELYIDHHLTSTIREMVKKKYLHQIEDYRFELYGLLGYNRQFSEMAHQVIQRNNMQKEPLRNADILRRLGDFYEKNGTGGSEYLLNACVLYCKLGGQDIHYRNYDMAQQHLEQAEVLYSRLSIVNDLTMTLMEVKRLRALLAAWQGKEQEGISVIDKVMAMAGEQNLPMEKQMQMFLSWGVVYRQSRKLQQAEQRLNNGLKICLNTGAFESVSTSALYRSHFLYELGLLHLNQMRDQHDPRIPIGQQEYVRSKLNVTTEGQLIEALELREKESTEPFEVCQCHLALGQFYLTLSDYQNAKVHTRKGLIKLDDIQYKVNPQILVEINYDLGSISYKLEDYPDAQVYYQRAIDILRANKIEHYWQQCIRGNLALTLLREGKPQARQMLDSAKEIISNAKGSNHYDYLFLLAEERKITNSMDSSQYTV